MSLLRVVDPLEYYRAYLKAGVRPDGRALLRGRSLSNRSASIASADGSALIHLGNTVVMAGVQCETTAPAEAEPSRGRIVVSLELPAVCSPAVAAALSSGGGGGGAGKIDRDKAVLVELLQRTANGGAVDLETLCVVEGVAVWSCYCDLYVLEHDGNLADAAMLAMLAALASVRLPRVTADEASGVLTVVEERAVPVALARPLFPCSFGVLSGELLLDLCAEEEGLTSATFTLLLDASGELQSVHKPGGAPLEDGWLATALEAAKGRLPELTTALTAKTID